MHACVHAVQTNLVFPSIILTICLSQVLKGEKKVGQKVAVIGGGGIGFDVAEFELEDLSGMPALKPFFGSNVEEWPGQSFRML